MKFNNKVLVIIIALLFTMISCEKHDVFQEPTGSDYFSEEQGMMFMADSTSFWACKNYLCFMCSGPIHYNVSINSADSENAQGFRLTASSAENCSNSDSLDYYERMKIWLKQGVVSPEVQVIDLTDPNFVDEISYYHYGDNMDGDFGLPHGTYDQVLAGALVIDSVRFPEYVHHVNGKIWGTFWMDLVKLNKNSGGAVISRDTIHIRKGYYKSNMSGTLHSYFD